MIINNSEQIREKEDKRKASVEKILDALTNGRKSSGLTMKMVEDYKNNIEMKKAEKIRKNNLKKELEEQIKEREK